MIFTFLLETHTKNWASGLKSVDVTCHGISPAPLKESLILGQTLLRLFFPASAEAPAAAQSLLTSHLETREQKTSLYFHSCLHYQGSLSRDKSVRQLPCNLGMNISYKVLTTAVLKDCSRDPDKHFPEQSPKLWKINI